MLLEDVLLKVKLRFLEIISLLPTFTKGPCPQFNVRTANIAKPPTSTRGSVLPTATASASDRASSQVNIANNKAYSTFELMPIIKTCLFLERHRLLQNIETAGASLTPHKTTHEIIYVSWVSRECSEKVSPSSAESVNEVRQMSQENKNNTVTLTSLGIASSCELVGAEASNPAK